MPITTPRIVRPVRNLLRASARRAMRTVANMRAPQALNGLMTDCKWNHQIDRIRQNLEQESPRRRFALTDENLNGTEPVYFRERQGGNGGSTEMAAIADGSGILIHPS